MTDTGGRGHAPARSVADPATWAVETTLFRALAVLRVVVLLNSIAINLLKWDELAEPWVAVAGLAVGYPAEAPQLSMRLPLSVTVHRNTFLEDGLDDAIEAYDTFGRAAETKALKVVLARS